MTALWRTSRRCTDPRVSASTIHLSSTEWPVENLVVLGDLRVLFTK